MAVASRWPITRRHSHRLESGISRLCRKGNATTMLYGLLWYPAAGKEFEKFLSAYDYVYKIPQMAEGQRPMVTDYYRYYTHYPLDNNTFPKSKELGLIEIAPYDKQTLVEGNFIRTWGS